MEKSESKGTSLEKEPVRCINLDWLEVYCLEPKNGACRDAYYFREHGYSVVEREYGTRMYAQMFTIFDDHDIPMLEVRRKPLSDKAADGGLFPSESCHIRMVNNYLYTPDPVGTLRNFLAQHDYYLVKIFRLDLCLDIETFDGGDYPARFIERYMKGVYSKVYQSNISAHGTDRWDGRLWNSLAWGNKTAMVSTKLYCKSLELSQGKDKPYIRWAWYESGLVDDPISCMKTAPDGHKYTPDIWRIEFSIKSSAKKWFIMEDYNTRKHNEIYMPHTIDMYDDSKKLLTVFASLCSHYFHFKYYEDGVRKDRCKDKMLFKFTYQDTLLKLDRGASHKPSSSKLERLIYLLLAYKETKHEPTLIHAIDTIVTQLRTEQVYDFVGDSWSHEDTLALRLLLQEQLNGSKRSDIVQRKNEIANMVKDLFDSAFLG